MKYLAKDIARALVDVAHDPENTNLSGEVDEALRLLKVHNPGRSFRSFPTLVERALRKAGREVEATLITPTGDAGTIGHDIEKELTKLLKQKIHLKQHADKNMLGGAILIVNDERLDVSIPGALRHLAEYLKESPLLISKS